MTRVNVHQPPDVLEGAFDFDRDFWREHSQITLQPVAAPSILGLYCLAGATFVVGSNLAGWWGTAASVLYLFPFVAVVGGVAQLLASMWAYRARDGLATAVHGTWGAFWLSYGVLFLLVATGALAAPTGRAPALGYWFIAAAAVTWACAVAALTRSTGLTAVLALLAAGATLAAVGYVAGQSWAVRTAGWLFVCSAIAAWYVATAMMLADESGRPVLPIGRRLAPGERAPEPIQFRFGEPGIRHGQ
jgi:succinate-acetate transporter protein